MKGNVFTLKCRGNNGKDVSKEVTISKVGTPVTGNGNVGTNQAVNPGVTGNNGNIGGNQGNAQ